MDKPLKPERWVVKAWRQIRPAGRSARLVAVGIMLIMGLGRLGLWVSAALARTLTVTEYGVLLTVSGLLLLLTLPVRLRLWGRLAAGLAACLLVGMGLDTGTWGVTRLIEWWLALFLIGEVFTSHDD